MFRKIKNIKDDGLFAGFDSIGALLFALVMIGVVAAALYTLFSGTKIAQMQQGLTTTRMQVQGLYANASNYTGLDNTLALKTGVVPRKFVKGSALKTPWGGDMTLTTGSDTGTFIITLAGIGQEECTKLSVYQLDSWESVAVNETVATSTTSVATIASACGTTNTITYTAR